MEIKVDARDILHISVSYRRGEYRTAPSRRDEIIGKITIGFGLGRVT